MSKYECIYFHSKYYVDLLSSQFQLDNDIIYNKIDYY